MAVPRAYLRSPAVRIALGIFAVTTAFEVGSALFNENKDTAVEKSLEVASAKMNRTCPQLLDDEVRLDNTSAGPGKVFTFHYSLVKRAKADLTVEKFAETVRPDLVVEYKSSPKTKSFRDQKVALHYRYTDKNGDFIADIVVGPDDLK